MAYRSLTLLPSSAPSPPAGDEPPGGDGLAGAHDAAPGVFFLPRRPAPTPGADGPAREPAVRNDA